MLDDLDLKERFEPLGAAALAPITGVDALRARVAVRRRRRRGVVAAGSALGALAVIAAIASGAASTGGPGRVDEVRTVAPTDPTIPASYGTGLRLVVGAVPAELASLGCRPEERVDHSVTLCSFGIPGTVGDDGAHISMRFVNAAILDAWERSDASATIAALQGGGADARFVELGGRKVLAVGPTGSDQRTASGTADRIVGSYEVLIGDAAIQVNVDGVTEGQLDTLIRGLGTYPVDLGFTIPLRALPEGAEAIAQGQERRWYEPDPFDPSRSDDNGGDAVGITYAFDGRVIPLSVSVVRNVAADDYIRTWATQQEQQHGADLRPVETHGRAGIRARLDSWGIADETSEGDAERLAIAADATTVILVDGTTLQDQALLQIAGTTTVRADPTAPTRSTDPTDPGPDLSSDPQPDLPSTGWYVPRDLPEGWVLEKGVAQATDGAGEAQLWLRSPADRLMVVTLRVPDDRWTHDDRWSPRTVDGVEGPVYEWPSEARGPTWATFLMDRDDATISVDWLPPRADDPAPDAGAQAAGEQDVEALLAALVPATTERWQAYLAEVPAPPVLLEAATLEDLPDES